MALSMEQRPSASQRVQAALSAAGIAARIEEFPSSTRTAQEAADAVGTSVGQIVKSLVFLAGGVPVLALVSGANRLDPARLEALTGLEIGKADADAVRRATGYSIGGVPPIGFPATIRPSSTAIYSNTTLCGPPPAHRGTCFRLRPTTWCASPAAVLSSWRALRDRCRGSWSPVRPCRRPARRPRSASSLSFPG